MNVIKEVLHPEDGVVQINFELPQGLTAKQLTDFARNDIREVIANGGTFGKVVRLNGRMTTGMCLLMGHELAHISKSVEIFDPKEGEYYRVIWH